MSTLISIHTVFKSMHSDSLEKESFIHFVLCVTSLIISYRFPSFSLWDIYGERNYMAIYRLYVVWCNVLVCCCGPEMQRQVASARSSLNRIETCSQNDNTGDQSWHESVGVTAQRPITFKCGGAAQENCEPIALANWSEIPPHSAHRSLIGWDLTEEDPSLNIIGRKDEHGFAHLPWTV